MIFQGYIEERNSKIPHSEISFLDLCTIHQLHLYPQLSDSNISNATAGTSRHLLLDDACSLNFLYIITSWSHFIDISSATSFPLIPMIRTNSMDSLSTKLDVFYVERSSQEGYPARNITPVVLNSTELSGAYEKEVSTIWSVASPEPQIVTIESDSNESTKTVWKWAQQPIHPMSLIGLKLPPNLFNVLNTMALIIPNEEDSPQSPEPKTRLRFLRHQCMWVPLKSGRHRTQLRAMPHFTQKTSLGKFFGTFLPATLLTQTNPDQYPSFRVHPPHRFLRGDKREVWPWGCLFLRRGVSQHTCEARG